MKQFIAIDIGGTDVKYAVIDEQVKLHHAGSMETSKEDGGKSIGAQVERLVAQIREKEQAICGVGISTAGVVDSNLGEIVFAGGTIPGYTGTNLKKIIIEKHDLPTYVTNDVNAAALGELWQGAGRKYEDFFCVTIGTGIGGALIVNRKLVVGKHFRAGEIGHSLYDPTSNTTFEQRASTAVLIQKVKEAIPTFSDGGKEIFSFARQNIEPYKGILDQWIDELARGFAQIVMMVDPEVIIVGGGVSAQGAHLLDPIEQQMMRYIPNNFSHTQLITAELGNHAGLYGAVFPFFNTKG